MRHIATLIAGLIVGPLAWVMLALGQQRTAAAFADAEDSALRSDDFVRPLLLLAAAGLLLGLLGTLQFSPLGPLVLGALYTLSSTLLLIAPSWVLDVFTEVSVAGRRVDLAAPIRSGAAMVVGVLLMAAALSAKRWRRVRVAEPVDEPETELERPLGADGLGFTRPYQDHEVRPYPEHEDLALKYAMDPGPPPPERQAGPAGNQHYGW